MRKGRTGSAAALAAALAACSQPTDQTSGRTPEPNDRQKSATATASVQSADARKILQRAIAVMAAEPVTGFKFEAMLSGHPAIVVEGFADVRVGWQANINATAPDESTPAVIDVRSVGDSTWMQMRDWPPDASGCWLDTTGKAPLGIQPLASPIEPGYVSILGALHAEGFSDSSPNSLVGELDLSAALGLLQAQLFEYIEWTESQIANARVPVEIGYKRQRITRVSFSGAAVLNSIEGSGGEVISMSRSILETSEYTVSYPAQTDASDLAAPPTNLVIPDGRSGCH